jgi:putative ABC transport system ATP-binding protein
VRFGIAFYLSLSVHIIDLVGVSRYFGAQRTTVALENIDLQVRRGEIVSIMGPSGSGKSTLLNLIGGLDRPSKGSVVIDGENMAVLSEDKMTRLRRDKIGFIFQFFNLIPILDCVGNVALPLLIKGWNKRKADQRATELLQLVQLGDRLEHLPDELSGGERQRVAIARALASNPPILLADEPTGNLDTEAGAEILKMIIGFSERFAATVLIVTHDGAVAESCSRTVFLKDGRIIADQKAAKCEPKSDLSIDK